MDKSMIRPHAYPGPRLAPALPPGEALLSIEPIYVLVIHRDPISGHTKSIRKTGGKNNGKTGGNLMETLQRTRQSGQGASRGLRARSFRS
jgi:hypothetical protein